MRVFLILTGFLASILIVGQLVLGMLIRSGTASPGLRTAHFHSGTLMVVVSLLYIALSLVTQFAKPSREPR